jgi:hypothetical protein
MFSEGGQQETLFCNRIILCFAQELFLSSRTIISFLDQIHAHKTILCF